MAFPKAVFKVVETKNCPLYDFGDLFSVTGITISMHSNEDNTFVVTAIIHSPEEKENCKILNGDLTRIIIQYERADRIPVCMVSCSGCTGSIRLEYTKTLALTENGSDENYANELASMLHLLSDFAFFKNIDYFMSSKKNLNRHMVNRGCFEHFDNSSDQHDHLKKC